jgi:hypothetical protein
MTREPEMTGQATAGRASLWPFAAAVKCSVYGRRVKGAQHGLEIVLEV